MRDVVVIAVMVAAIVLLAAYVAFCDSVVRSGEESEPVPVRAEARRGREPVV